MRPTNAILRFEGQTASPREAAKTLAVEYVLTGTLQPTGALLRVSVQLVRAADETSLWGDHYDIDRKDLLTLQDRIAAEVAAALPIRMSSAERDRLTRPQPRNTEAFELYLRGRAALVQNTAESTRYAVASFEKAVEIDPRDALAHAGLATASAQMRIRFAPEPELQGWVDRAQKEAAAALALDPNLAEAHEARAAVARNIEFDWDLAINESDRALALNPSLEMPHLYRAAAFYHFGLFDRARAEIRLGMENNPMNRSRSFAAAGHDGAARWPVRRSGVGAPKRAGVDHQRKREHLSGAGAGPPREEDRGRRDSEGGRREQERAGPKTRPGHAGQLPRREKRTREGAGAHHRRACRHIYGSPRRLRSRGGVRAGWRSCRGSTLADPGGSGRISLLPVVRPTIR